MRGDIKVVDRGSCKPFEFHQRGFPSISLNYKEGFPEELFECIKTELINFDYNKLATWHKKSFKKQKECGFEIAQDYIKDAINKLPKQSQKNIYSSKECGIIYINDWFCSIGSKLFNSLHRSVKARYLPMSDFYFEPEGDFKQDIVIKLSSLNKIDSIGYVSPIEPKIEIDNKKYIIAYTEHVITQMGAIPWRNVKEPKRFMPYWNNYLGLGDFHGFLYGCNNFEKACITTEANRNEPAVTCYEKCISPEWFQWHYVEELLENWDQEQNYYYRVGYFPIAIRGNYAILKTLLLPGFKKTPEYNCLLKSNILKSERKSLCAMFTKDNRFEWLYKERDFSFLKKMHQYIPQVIASNKKMFDELY